MAASRSKVSGAAGVAAIWRELKKAVRTVMTPSVTKITAAAVKNQRFFRPLIRDL